MCLQHIKNKILKEGKWDLKGRPDVILKLSVNDTNTNTNISATYCDTIWCRSSIEMLYWYQLISSYLLADMYCIKRYFEPCSHILRLKDSRSWEWLHRSHPHCPNFENGCINHILIVLFIFPFIITFFVKIYKTRKLLSLPCMIWLVKVFLSSLHQERWLSASAYPMPVSLFISFIFYDIVLLPILFWFVVSLFMASSYLVMACMRAWQLRYLCLWVIILYSTYRLCILWIHEFISCIFCDSYGIYLLYLAISQGTWMLADIFACVLAWNCNHQEFWT